MGGAMALTSDFQAKAEQKIQALAAKQEEFGLLGPVCKALLLDEILAALRDAQQDLPNLADAAVISMGHESVEGADATMPWVLEQLLMVSWVTQFCNRFKANLESVQKTGTCKAAKQVRTREDGRKVADVFPLDGDSHKPTKRCQVELWMLPGKEATQGAMLSHKPQPNSVGLVLGAGNVAALAIMDCLHILFQQNSVVLYKVHPIRHYQEPFARRLFAPLIEKGYFDTIKEENGLPDSQFLVSHPLLCNIHMTGATETHDCIVWGPKEGREERRQQNKPIIDLTKVNVTSELGCVTPYMVCPGNWTDAEIMHHALHLAVVISSNNSYYCNAPKVLVLAEEWPQKDAFLGALKGILKTLPPVAPYYPGSHRRYQGFEAAYGEQMEKIEGPGFERTTKFGAHIPWTLIHTSADPMNLAASDAEYAFRTEPFCPVLTICTLKGISEAEPYLEHATAFVNRCVWGTLSCSLIVHPSTVKTSAVAVENAIAALEYGCVAINCWSGQGYGFECGVWGAYAGGDPPRERIECLQSGLGFVGNCLSFDHVEKSVLRCPFIDKDVQIGTGGALTRETCENVTNLLINPGLGSLMRVLFPTMHRLKRRALACGGRPDREPSIVTAKPCEDVDK